MPNNDKNYHKTRFKFDPGRLKVWRAITDYLQPYVGQNKTVLDLGCGYGDFINQIQAKKKYGLDLGPDVKNYIDKDVKFINKPSTSLGEIPAKTVDVTFSSNLFEHLDRTDIDKTMSELRRCMKDTGSLILIGPNFRYAYKSYFDDYTHKTIFTHVSLSDLMQEHGFRPIKVMPKFLPLTLKSRLPKSYYLTKAYLYSPFKPMGGQMLLIFKVDKNAKNSKD